MTARHEADGRTRRSVCVERARAGDDEAFAELYRRHRRGDADCGDGCLRSRHDVDDVVADAFAAVLQAMRNGNGPREDFRAYLMACVRNPCTCAVPRDGGSAIDLDAESGGRGLEDPERYVEADTVRPRVRLRCRRAGQQTLWLAEVEERSVDRGRLDELGLRPNAVAALTYRAREGFASAYLSEHVAHAETPRVPSSAPSSAPTCAATPAAATSR